MADTPAGGSGTDVAGLIISADSSQVVSATDSLNKLGTATVSVVKSIDDLSNVTEKNSKWVAESNQQYKNKIETLQAEWRAEQALLDLEKDAEKIRQQALGTGAALIAQLNELVKLYGLTREQVFSLRAAELGVTEAAGPLIAELTLLKEATAKYGAVITDVASIEAARIAWEQSALTAFNAFKTRTLAENAAAEESAMTALNAQRIRIMAENRAAAVADIEAMEALRIKAIENEKTRITVFNAFKIRTMNENRAEAMRILTEQEVQAAAIAEKQAIAEINWARTSVQGKIAELERLKAYQASGAISTNTIDNTFSSAAINDIASLTRYQEEYAASLVKTATNHKAVTETTGGLSAAFENNRVRTEALVIAHEAWQGRLTRIPGSLMVMVEYLNASSLSLTGFSIAGLAAAGALLALGYEIYRGVEQTKAFNDALNRTNGYSGETRESMEALAQSVGKVHGQFKEAYSAVTTLTQSGKFTSDQIKGITEAVVGLAHAFGTPLQDSIKEFETLSVRGTGKSATGTMQVTKAVETLDEKYHFLDTTILEHIIQLEKEGKAREASQLAIKAYTEEGVRAASAAQDYMGWIEKGWNGITFAIKRTGQALADIGKESLRANREATLINLLPKNKDGSLQTDESRMSRTQLFQYKELMKVQAEILDVMDKAAQKEKETAIRFDANHALSQRAIEDKVLMKKTSTELEDALAKNAEQRDAIEAKEPGYIAAHQQYEVDRVNAIIKAHSQRVAATNDGRRAILEANINASKADDAQLKEEVSMRDKITKEAVRSGVVTTEEGHQELATRREIELVVLKDNYDKKVAFLTAYQGRTAADTEYAKKMLVDVTAAYQLASQKIRDATQVDAATLADQKSQALDKLAIAVDKQSTAEIAALTKSLEKQKQHNAEIGKTREEVELARQAQVDAGTAQLIIEANAYDAVLANQELIREWAPKEISIYAQKAAALREQIDLRNKDSEAFKNGAVLEADAKIAKDASDLWKRTNNKIGNDLASAIVDGGGAGVKKLIRDMEIAFAKTILRPFLDPISGGVASFASPGAAQSTSSALGTASSLASLGSTAGTVYGYGSGLAGFALNSVGASAAGYAAAVPGLTSFSAGSQAALLAAQTAEFGGAGLASTVGAGATAAGAAGTATTAATGLTAALAAVPVWGWVALAAIAAYGIFSNDGTEQNTKLTFGGSSNPVSGSTSTGRQQSGGNYVGGEGINTAFGSFGVTDQFWMDSIAAVNKPKTDAFLQAVKQSDDLLAQYLTSDERAKVTSALNNKNTILSTGPEGSDPSTQFGQALTSRIHDILAAVDSGLTKFTDNFQGTGDALVKEAQTILGVRANLDKYAAIFGETVSVDSLEALKTGTEAFADAMDRLVPVFTLTNAIAQTLGKTSQQAFGAVGLASDAARERLVTLAGSITTLQTNAVSYNSTYLTAAEQAAPANTQLLATMKALGLGAVQTKDQFRAVVEGLDLSTQAGAQMYTTLMALNQQFAAYAGSMESAQKAYDEAASAANNALQTAAGQYKGFVDAVISATADLASARDAVSQEYQKAIDNQSSAKDTVIAAQNGITDGYITATNAVMAAQQKIIDSSSKLKEFISKLGFDFSTATASQKMSDLWNLLQQNAGAASKGDATANTNLQNLATSFLTLSKDNSKSAVDYNRDIANVKNLLNNVANAQDSLVTGTGGTISDADQLTNAIAQQKIWSDAVTASGASFAKASTDIMKAYNDSITAQKASDTAVIYWSTVAKIAGATLTDNSQAMVKLGDSLLANVDKTQQALVTANANLVAANIIKGNLDLQQTTALQSFVDSIRGVNSTAQTALTSASTLFTTASSALLSGVAGAASVVQAASDAMKNWQAVVSTTNTGLSSSAATGASGGGTTTTTKLPATTAGLATVAQWYAANPDAYKTPDPSGVQYWATLLTTNSLNDVKTAFAQNVADVRNRDGNTNTFKPQSIGTFASGGIHTGGLRIVGENGPELEATGSSKIWNASETADMLSSKNGKETNTLLRTIIDKHDAAMKQQGNIAAQINGTLIKIHKILIKVTPNENSISTSAAV